MKQQTAVHVHISGGRCISMTGATAGSSCTRTDQWHAYGRHTQQQVYEWHTLQPFTCNKECWRNFRQNF
jgi:hypothetical protein